MREPVQAEWRYGPNGGVYIARGQTLVLALIETQDERPVVQIYGNEQILGWRDTMKLAVELAEEIYTRWFPGDPKPKPPEIEQKPGTKTPDGRKVVSSNKYAAPI